ncbi:unnamed protein product [Laminaria digitata]
MLSARAPATLNHRSKSDETPLSVACSRGHESLVSRVLSLGTVHQHEDCELPLEVTVAGGFVGVVRILLNAGIGAVGGKEALPNALAAALRHRQSKALRLLLAVDGKAKQSVWANVLLDGRPLIHYATGYSRQGQTRRTGTRRGVSLGTPSG